MVAEAVAAPETSQWPLSALRDETLALMDRKNWPTNRLAAELGMLQSTVEKFLNGGAPAHRLRELLVSLMARQGIEPPLTEPESSDPEAAAEDEDEARLIEAFRRFGFAYPEAMISDLRAAGVTLIAPPKPGPTYTLTFTTPLFDTLRALVETSRHRTPEEGELLDHIAILLSNATPDETERTHE